ncbi:DUF1315 family protein [Endozoicomonas ascidiicola]|uniref:DUF1315 family protein n=1 Tax=Endozoicomonas ascidiicola TaxID=1698521 RepID=UPI0008318374|nr:DUF1315 family protein [Endozoicomonas ascidiicola]
MQLDAFLEKMNPAIHQSLRQSLELGKWPDGRTMTQEERDASLQAVIVYEYQHLPESERIGYMPAKCGSSGKKHDDKIEAEEASILRFQDA